MRWALFRWLTLVLVGSLAGLGGTAVAHAEIPSDVSSFEVRHVDDELQLSAQLQFELPSVVDDALLKGIPVAFVMVAEVFKDRWYWYDKRLASAQRHIRLAYQPLSRRWRLNVSAGSGAVGLSLNQSFDTLGQALASIKRVSNWKVADLADLEGVSKCRVEYHFRLDLSQLPRPFQLGPGATDWDISVNAQTPVSLEGGK
jgi:hypothetical protein